MLPAISPGNYLFLILEPLWLIGGAIALSVLPTWMLARRLRLDGLTTLLVSVLGSYTLIYLLELGTYLLSAPQWLPLSVSCVCSLASVIDLSRPGGKSPSTGSFPWDGVLTWCALALWIGGMQSRIVVYGAGTWWGDWYEHYERALFFLDQLPPEMGFLSGMWSLPARGPLFNASAALLMSVFGRDFWTYQVLATVLNTFPVLALALMLRDMAKMRQLSGLLWAAMILGILPYAAQQETYTWTKFFTAGFILGGIHLYRLGCRHNRPWLVGWSFGAFTAGILAHYLAVVFVLFFLLHFVYSVLRKRWDWRVVLYPGIACSVLLGTWFGYLIVTFGLQATLTANSTFGDYAQEKAGPYGHPLARSKVFAGNMITTILPGSWRHGMQGLLHAPHIVQADYRAGEDTPSPTELNRQTEWFTDLVNDLESLPGAFGWAGGVGLLVAAALAIRRRLTTQERPRMISASPHDASTLGWRFWLIFCVLGIPLNIAASPDHSPYGVAHLNFQPFICLTAVLLLRCLQDMPALAKGCLFGLFLMQSALNTGALIALQERQVPIVVQPNGHLSLTGKLGLDFNYVNNYIFKLRKDAVFMSDRLGDLTGPFSLMATVIPIGLLIGVLMWSSSSKKKGEET